MAALLPNPEPQFCDADGHPYAGGTIATYVVGTSTPKQTWSDPNQTAANPNPIVLDAAGRCVMYADGDVRLVLEDAAGNQVWDQPSSTIVSAAMQPVMSAPTIADARNLLGVDDEIATEAANRALGDSKEAQWRIEADNAEAAARDAADTHLQSQIDAINATLAGLPVPTVTATQHGDAHVDASGHTRITFATPYTSLPDVVAQCVANNFDVNIASILVDIHGFEIWIAYGIPRVVPAPSIEFHWIAVGTEMPSILFDPNQQFCDADGKPLAGGTIMTYVAGTSTPKQVWQDHGGTALQTNPVMLDSAGRALLFGDGEYRLVLRDAVGNLVWDQYSTTIVSAAMQPIVAAPTIADARRLFGVDDAVAAEASARATADANEANWRIAADNALQTAIDNETGFRVAGDNYLQTVINNETTRAEAAEAALSAQIAAIPVPGTGSSSVTRTGTSTTDASGNFTATWATFSSVFGSFSVAESDPHRPGAGFTTTSITLSSYSGTLIHSNNLYPTATTTPVVSATFNWVATGT